MDSSGFSVNDPIHNLQHRLVLSRLTAFGPFQCTTLQTQVHILEEHEVLEDLVEKYLNCIQGTADPNPCSNARGRRHVSTCSPQEPFRVSKLTKLSQLLDRARMHHTLIARHPGHLPEHHRQ